MPAPTLDFDRLVTPPEHGDVLVLPAASEWLCVARENHETLSAATAPLLDSTLGAWRKRTRETLLGSDDALAFVAGHQPEFIHPGVWAKHVAAMRAAMAAGGVAVNLVVDNDAPKRAALTVPGFSDGVLVRRDVPFAKPHAGFTYEQIGKLDRAALERFSDSVREAMGSRFDDSMMPIFFEAAMGAGDPVDWVDQMLAGRRAIERRLGVVVTDHRVSDAWCSPMLVDILVNAERFAESYNGALATYRQRHRVRGAQRPIPDLAHDGGRCEAPLWIQRADEPRRRLFVARDGGDLRLFADRTEVGRLPAAHLGSCSQLKAILGDLPGWCIRPRALTLTIWARLLLADLFIHGIGGAKYDRISDTIIEDYYGLRPPQMACVSATLHLGLFHDTHAPNEVRALRCALRDLSYNPQRRVPVERDVARLVEQRDGAVRHAMSLREARSKDRRARRTAFDSIREHNSAILAAVPGAEAALRAEIAQAEEAERQGAVARGRDYFFGLYDQTRLRALLAAIPQQREFAV